MKPSELYLLEPERCDFDYSCLFGCYFNHMPEVGDSLWPLTLSEDSPKNTRVEIAYYKDHSYDGRRIWRLCAAFLDGKPFMIMQNAGREGDDHSARFITDVDLYQEAARYIKTLLPVRFAEIPDVVDPDSEIQNLTSFYSDSLDLVGRVLKT